MPDIDIVKIPNDPNQFPTIEIEFGHARVGGYRIYLWNPTNTTAREIGDGDNTDNKLDKFSLGLPASELNGHTIYLEAGINSANPGGTFSASNDGQYSVIASIEPSTGGSPRVYPGELHNGQGVETRFIKLEH